MTYRIIQVKASDELVLKVTFQNGVEKGYDIRQMYNDFPQFKIFESDEGLFAGVKVDAGGYGVSWNDELDLAAEEIWDNGVVTGKVYDVDIIHAVGVQVMQAREEAHMTQRQLAEKTGMFQAEISKIERGMANPSIQTLQRLAEGVGKRLKVEFLSND